jgi:hypothetical protein
VSDALALSDFQRRVLSIPEAHDLALLGGRGGGKSFTLLLLALRHVEQYGGRARPLYLRQSFPGVTDFELLCRDLFARAYGNAATYNAQSHLWRFPSGATFELGMLGGDADYQRYQGRSFSLLLLDECGEWPDPRLLDLLRSNLRGPKSVPVRLALAANPGGVGHQWIAARYVFAGAAPWQPFVEPKSGRTFVHCPSTYVDNAAIDRDAYRAQIEAATSTDLELRHAWLAGDWAVARGAFFASVLSEERSALDPAVWTPEALAVLRGVAPSEVRSALPDGSKVVRWRVPARGAEPWTRTYLSHDFGVTAPSVTFLCAESPGSEGPDGRYYPKGSILLLDELATCEPGQLNRGLGWTVPKLAEAVVEFCERWGVRPSGVADDACFAKGGHSAGSIADEFRQHGVNFNPARKADRRSGWERMRRYLEAAGKPDVPGLYVSRRCEYFWQTVPYLARDPKKPDDVDSRGPDHAADAARYALLRQESGVYVAYLMGFF